MRYKNGDACYVTMTRSFRAICVAFGGWPRERRPRRALLSFFPAICLMKEYVRSHENPARDQRRQGDIGGAVAFSRLHGAEADGGSENGWRGARKYAATDGIGARSLDQTCR